MKLKDVRLEKTDTCITYSLKRLGYEQTNLGYDDMEHHFDYIKFKTYDKLKVGDILLWNRNIQWEWIPWKIGDMGVVSERIPIGFHFAIYEGNSLISDLTRRTGKPPHYPYLRVRKVYDINKNPDWILREISEKG